MRLQPLGHLSRLVARAQLSGPTKSRQRAGIALRTGGSSGWGDLKFDGTNTNGAIYIPTGPADPTSPCAFEDAASAAAFDEYISGESCLDEQRGGIMERNSCRNPWQNQLDVAIRQRLPVLWGDAALEVQIFNFPRMLDADWGKVRTVGGGEFFRST